MRISGLIGKTVWIGTDAAGVAGDVVFGEDTRKCDWVVVFGEDGDFAVPYGEIVSARSDALVMNDCERFPVPQSNNPIGAQLSDERGRILGRVADVECEGTRVVSVILERTLKLGRGKLCMSDGVPVYVRPAPRGKPAPKAIEQVEEMVAAPDRESSAPESETVESPDILPAEESAEPVLSVAESEPVERELPVARVKAIAIEPERDANAGITVGVTLPMRVHASAARSENVAELYREITDFSLTVATDEGVAPPVQRAPAIQEDAKPESIETDAVIEEAEHIPARIIADFSFLLGRCVTDDITVGDAAVIRKGELIRAATVGIARKHSKLFDLTLKSRT